MLYIFALTVKTIIFTRNYKKYYNLPKNYRRKSKQKEKLKLIKLQFKTEKTLFM